LITANQLEEAVRIQQKTGKKVGEILVEKGYVTQAELEEALAYGREMAAAKGRGAGEMEERREAEGGWELRD